MAKRNHNGNLLYAGLDPIARNNVMAMVNNASLNRVEGRSAMFDKRRDIDKECGYKKTEELTVTEYKAMYDREPIARRVVEVLPAESWKVVPTVKENQDTDEETEFELAWKELPQTLRGDSWFQGEEGNPLWEVLERVDKLSRIGRFGVLLLGFNDGKELKDPVEPSDTLELMYVRAFHEDLASIVNTEQDPTNSRFGQPVEYELSFEDPTNSGILDRNTAISTQKVHWSRCIHVVDGVESSEVYGIPSQQSVFNRLYDLRKTYGGSAEMFWKGGFFGLSLETHPQLGGDVEIDTDSIKDEMEQYENSLSRYFALSGMSAKSITPQIADPSAHIDKQIEAICIVLGIPKRVFMGSERGELSSGQDSEAWDGRLMKRQNRHITPRIVAPTIDRLILVGVLPEPSEGYGVDWPDLHNLDEATKAEIAIKRTDAMTKYVAGNVEALMVPLDYLTRELGYTTEEAEAILDAAVEAAEERGDEDAAIEEAAEARAAEMQREAAIQQQPPQEQPVPPVEEEDE